MNAAGASGARSNASAQRVGRDAVGHPQLDVVLGRDEPGGAAAQDQTVDQARMRVALEDHPDARGRQGQAQGVVALGGAVGEKPGSGGAVGVRGQLLGALVRGGRRPDVDALDVLRHVEQQSTVAQRGAQPRVGALAALVAGDVEAQRAAETVRR